MLYHKKCHSLIRMNSYFKISTMPIVTKQGLKKGMAEVDIDLGGQKEDKAEFFCPQCKEQVGINDLLGQCAMHGTFHPVADLYFNMDDAYIVMCLPCIKEYNIPNYKPLIALINQ